jgi:nucleoside-diphosphate kinase
MTEERTLILVKPDGVESGHIGEVITRLERRRFKIEALKVLTASDKQLQTHYSALVDKPYFPGIQKFMQSGPLVAMVASGTDIVNVFHNMVGATNPSEAAIGTIRADFGRSWGPGPIKNVVHSSDSVESAQREIPIWFPELG